MKSNDYSNAYDNIPGNTIRKDIICNDTTTAAFLNPAFNAGNQPDMSIYSNLNNSALNSESKQSNVSKFIIVICYKCYTYIKLAQKLKNFLNFIIL